MNKKETTASLAIIGLALLATITMISPTQALALGHWNVDGDSIPTNDFADDDMDSSGTSDNTDGEEVDPSDEEEEDSTTAGNTGEDSTDNSNGKEDSSSSEYEALQDCLAEIEESPTEEEVQDCVNSSYSGMGNSEDTPIESTDGGAEENGEHVSADDTEHVSTDDTEEQEEEHVSTDDTEEQEEEQVSTDDTEELEEEAEEEE